MNRLATESSPYLRQHAGNPVHWYPWSAEAFTRAEAEDKPVLISIGYASCHWCHVMAHESFEDATIAAAMNEAFINVKVDREERPDIDAIYMEATQAMTGQGGWPMTVFALPDGRPFFAGTYFGKQSMPGHPSFAELIDAVRVAWREQRSSLDEQATNLRNAVDARTSAIAQSTGDHKFVVDGQSWLSAASNAIAAGHDKEWGGFGPAPKFPHSTYIDLLMRTGDRSHWDAIQNSLDAMASGGIYDHVGGGFHRYSVDAFWMVPHFEKMLYDQALIARTYVDAFLISGEERYKQVATETIEYVLRDLAAPEGGWYSSEDADSEGEEGRFYVWRPEQIDTAVGDPDIAHQLRDWYGVTRSGNFEGSNILHRPKRGDLVRPEAVEHGRRLLFEARKQRVRPSLDDKVLTEWNAMFLSTLAYSAGALGRPDWLDRALTTAEFLVNALRDDEGRWLRVWHAQAGAKQLAFANDYAWLAEAFTRLSEASGQARWRALATEVAEQMIELFWDNQNGGLFTVGNDGEELMVRSKDLFDSAIPSSTSVAAYALVRLAHLADRSDLTGYAGKLIDLVADAVAGHPTAFPYLLGAVDLLTAPVTEIVVAGSHSELVQFVQQSYLPRAVLAWGEPDQTALWQDRTDGAYVCQNYACRLPVLSVSELSKQLTEFGTLRQAP
jgi:uncharacterized protein